jgi:RNA polymerase sigma-70 factor (ECF subfamily)
VRHTEPVLLGFSETGIHSPDIGRLFLERSFEDLFGRHYPRLVRTLLRLVGDSGQAEELAADAFYRLYRQRPEGDCDKLAGWLNRTAMNLGLDAIRSNSRRVRREGLAGREAVRSEVPGTPLHELLAEEQRARVRHVLSRLKPQYSQILLMSSAGFEAREISAFLGIRTDSLYVQVGRAKAKFEHEYVKLYGGVQ